MTDRCVEVGIKEKRLSNLLLQNGLDGICLSRTSNFAWFTAGGNNRVVTSLETGAAALVILEDRKYIVAPNNEIERFMDEQVADQGFVPWTYEWYDNRQMAISKLVGSKKIGTDIPMENWRILDAELKRLRFSLTAHEVKRAEKLAGICSSELAATCAEIVPGSSEWNIQGNLSRRLLEHGVHSPVLLVAVDERTRYRHPVPGRDILRKYAIIGLVGELGGLHIALSRSVHFGGVPQVLQDFYEMSLAVERTFLEHSVVGGDCQNVFRKGIATYAELGHKDEWKRHHQGGAIGYAPREYRAGAGESELIQVSQMLAWNPTMENTKCEDTCLVTSDGTKFLTTVPQWWPTRRVSTQNGSFVRPLILER